MDLGRVHRWPPELVSRAQDIGTGWWGAGDAEHPVHCRTTWRDRDGTEVQEWVWGLVTAWTRAAMHVVLWRHGEHRVWLRRDDVEPCTCTELHQPGWWPASLITTAAPAARGAGAP